LSVPRVVCLKCNVPFRIDKNGVVMDAYIKGGHYYTSRADRWKCPECNATILFGFGQPYNYRSDLPEGPITLCPTDEVVIVHLE